MPNLKILPMANAKLPASAKGGSAFGGKASASLSRRVSAFHQFGDAVNRTKNGERSDKIYGSINAAIKNKHTPDSKTTGAKSNPALNQNLKPTIK